MHNVQSIVTLDRLSLTVVWCLFVTVISACSTVPISNIPTTVKDPQDLLIVDCLLPSQVRQLGTQFTYLAPRQAIRTPGANCAKRGGEYVAHDKADFRSALSIWLPLAEKGDPQAQTYVGEIYEKGIGTRASYAIAAQWYERAAQQNYSRAQINLGYLYESGLGVNRNLIQALNLYRQASGFTNADLEFVSSVEIANRKAAQTQTQNLQTQVSLLQQEIKIGREKLRQQQQAIDRGRSEREKLRQSLTVSEHEAADIKSRTEAGINSQAEAEIRARAEAQITARAEAEIKVLTEAEIKARTEANDAIRREKSLLKQLREKSKASTEKTQKLEQAQAFVSELEQRRLQDEQQLKVLEQQLYEQETKLSEQTNTLESLNTELAIKQAAIDKTAADQIIQIIEQGPIIDIIEPPVLVTRGAPSLLVDVHAKLNLIGRVSPVESLYLFQINGEEQTVSESGMFNFSTSTFGLDKLQLLAINEQGTDTRIQLELSAKKTQVSTPVKAPESNSETAILKKPLQNIDWGKYHALIIGNKLYDELTNLSTANNDAIATEQLLREKYGFQTDLLLDADQKSILNAMERMRSTLGPEDNLVIYYAGHGKIDPYSGSGYWLPVDASESDRQLWIANSALTAMIDTMKAKHVLVIADSSYSGSFSRTAMARPLPETSSDLKIQWLKAVSRSRVRTILSSGGTSPVLDGTADSAHSVFANSFLDALRSNTGILEGYGLFYQLQQGVARNAASLDVKHIPQYAPIRHAGHQAGDFLFVPVSQSEATHYNSDQAH